MARVLFYASTTPEGEHGDLVVFDRATGQEKVIAHGINTETRSRAACQRWNGGGAPRVSRYQKRPLDVHVVMWEPEGTATSG